MIVVSRVVLVRALCVVVLSVLFGCDQITALKEKFFPKKQDQETTSSQKSQNNILNETVASVQPAAVQSVDTPLPNDVLARVGEWSITLDEFNERVNNLKQSFPEFNASDPESKKQILDELIRQQLLVVEAEKSGLAQKKQILSAVEDFKRTLLVQEIANQITKDIAATEEEAKDFYAKNKDKLADPVQWKVREILVYTETAAKEILVKLLQGSDFVEIAKTESKGKTAASGGELAVFTKAPFTQLQSAISVLNKGETSSIFKGPEGYYIVKIDDKKGGEAKPFAEIKDQLISGLTLQKQQQAVLNYLNTLAAKTTIKVNEELLKEKK